MKLDLELSLLGPLHIRAGDRTLRPRGPKITQVLALLAIRAGRTLETETLVDELWGDQPPARAVGTLRTHVYHLRRALAEQLGPAGDKVVRTEPPGYRLDVDPQQVDAVRFAELAARGRHLLNQGEPAQALSVAHSGLSLRRGTPLSNVPTGNLLRGHVRRLDELHTLLIEVRIEAKMSLGRHRELIPELCELTVRHPLNEWFHARLMEVLRRSDRRADALWAFQELRLILDLELGLSPSVDLLNLQRRILHEDGLQPAED